MSGTLKKHQKSFARKSGIVVAKARSKATEVKNSFFRPGRMGLTESPVVENKSRVSPLLTDFYELTMAFAYFVQGRQDEHAVFDVFFRENPFKGQYTVFAGLSEVTSFINNFELTDEEVEYVCSKSNLNIDGSHEFFEFKKYLKTLKQDRHKVVAYAIKEGSVVFPRVPVIRIEGPLGLCQLLETPILNLTGFASLVTTNAARLSQAAKGKRLLEFGLRRAQGPNGGMTASRYSVVGGFAGTSNTLAGFEFGVPISGTMAHAFICSYSEHTDIKVTEISVKTKEGQRKVNFAQLVEIINLNCIKLNIFQDFNVKISPNEGELKAFTAYAVTFPEKFLALVDTYDTILSGVPNFLVVACALMLAGRTPLGIRLDSGDLFVLAKETRAMFEYFIGRITQIVTIAKSSISSVIPNIDLPGFFDKLKDVKFGITASNDLNEDKIHALLDRPEKCEIDSFGIGTHLATCQAQPALGMVYKLVETNGIPCIKFSQDSIKQTFPGAKNAYRLYRKGIAIGDVLDTQAENKSFVEIFSSVDLSHTVDLVNLSGTVVSGVQFDKVESLYSVFQKPETVTTAKDNLKKSLDTIDHRILEYVHKDPKFGKEKFEYPVYFTASLYEKIQSLKSKLHVVS